MHFVELNGVGMRYDLQGDAGPAVVLIHEMGGLLENWDEVVPGLVGDHRVLRYDVRGAGLSEKISGQLEIGMLTDDLLALLDAVGFKEPVTLVGCAVGAAIALAFAGRHPQRVAAVAALSPAIDMKPEDRAARLEMLEGIAKGGMRSIMQGALTAGYPAILRERNPERFRIFSARWLANDPESFIATYKMLIYMDIRDDIQKIACPALGVGGTLDTFRTPEYVRSIMSPIKDVEFQTIETSHHQPAATPETITQIVREFVARRVART
jgi:3-oxoadipate enol-lactonase